MPIRLAFTPIFLFNSHKVLFSIRRLSSAACPFLPPSLHPPSSPPSQAYPETGDSTAPSFTKYEVLGDDNLDAWVESGFGEFDDVEPSPVAYTIEGAEEGGARGEMEGEGQREEAKELTSEEIEASINAYNEYYPPASFDALVTAMQASWRTIILSRGKQGAKAMREFYRDLHKAHPELEQKVWIMETHATRSPVPEDPDTYNHWMSDEDILKMARVVRRMGGRKRHGSVCLEPVLTASMDGSMRCRLSGGNDAQINAHPDGNSLPFIPLRRRTGTTTWWSSRAWNLKTRWTGSRGRTG